MFHTRNLLAAFHRRWRGLFIRMMGFTVLCQLFTVTCVVGQTASPPAENVSDMVSWSHMPLMNWLFSPMGPLLLLQWLALLVFFLVGWMILIILPRIISALILFFLRHARNSASSCSVPIRRALRPIAYLGMIYFWFLGFYCVGMTPSFLLTAAYFIHPVGIILVMIALIRILDILCEWFHDTLEKNPTVENSVGKVLVDLSSGILKFIIICLAGITIAQVFGFSPLGIISGLGIGGIAIALAAQQTISNFFGSVTILLDQPFTVGDAVVVKGIEGTVETIGLRSTRIRTYYNSCVIIPNSELATSIIDNMGQRTSRRFKTDLCLQYDTPTAILRAFCAGTRIVVKNQPSVLRDDIRVNVSELAASSINVSLVCFFMVDNIHQENIAKEALILDILSLAEKLGVSFAFPSQTNYVVHSMPTEYPADEKTLTDEDINALGENAASGVLSRR